MLVRMATKKSGTSRPRASASSSKPRQRSGKGSKPRSGSKGSGSKASASTSDQRPRWKRLLLWLLVPGLVVGFFASAFLLVMLVQVPLPDDIAPATTTVLDATGEPVGSLTAEATQRDVALEDLSEATALAVLAAEDRDFYSHGGVSPLGIARALFVNVRAGAVEQGGSTITQQYVKNALVGSVRCV